MLWHRRVTLSLWGTVAEWVRAWDWRPGGPGFESHCGNFAPELWQFRLPHFGPVSFGGDTKSRRSFLYARGSKRSHQSAQEMCNLSWTPPILESKDNAKNNPVCNTHVLSASQYRKERKGKLKGSDLISSYIIFKILFPDQYLCPWHMFFF